MCSWYSTIMSWFNLVLFRFASEYWLLILFASVIICKDSDLKKDKSEGVLDTILFFIVFIVLVFIYGFYNNEEW